MTLKWIRKIKVCMQSEERAGVVKCEWLVDPGAGCVSITWSVGLKFFQKLGEAGPSVSLFLRLGGQRPCASSLPQATLRER